MTNRSREEVLNALLSLSRSTSQIRQELSAFDWDAEREIVALAASDVERALVMAASGRISTAELSAWAEMIEGREDIAQADTLREFVFEIANPEINGELTDRRIAFLLRRLRGQS
jgi:hypothetical protein